MELTMPGVWPMARNKKTAERGRYWKPSLVEEVINTFCEGSPTVLATRLTTLVGREVSRQMVHGWRLRGQFPPEIIAYVHRLTRLPLTDLIARNRPRFKI